VGQPEFLVQAALPERMEPHRPVLFFQPAAHQVVWFSTESTDSASLAALPASPGSAGLTA